MDDCDVEGARQEWLRLLRSASTEEDWARAQAALNKLLEEQQKRLAALLELIHHGGFPPEC